MVRLYQFSYSIYCEKVRWALDFKAIPWWRESLLPGPHLVRVLRMTGQRYVPVLELNDAWIHDSTRIIAALENYEPTRPLIPKAAAARRRALRIEDFCDEELGPPLKRLSYSKLLPHTRYCSSLMSVGRRPATKRAYQLSFPGVRAAFRAAMGLTERRIERAADQLERALDRLDQEITPTGYLVEDEFTVADLTAASVLSPLLPPPFSPYRMQSTLPDDVAAWRDQHLERPCVQWACGIYERHRGTCFAENGELKGSSVI